MKKKVISLLLAIGMVLGLTACGGGSGATSEAMTVTIEGNQYDLSGDFKEVVGQMVQDNLVLRNPYSADISKLLTYDENGEGIGVEWSEVEGSVIGVGFERPVKFGPSPVIWRNFGFFRDTSYESTTGIDGNADWNELENLEGYTFYRGNYSSGECVFYAFYVDGELVDLEEYRNELDAWKEEAESINPQAAFLKYFPDVSYYMSINLFASDLARVHLLEALEDDELAEGYVLLAFAVMDAGHLLEEGKIESYSYIEYRYDEEDGVEVSYNHYYVDEELSQYNAGMREYDEEKRAEMLEQMLNQ